MDSWLKYDVPHRAFLGNVTIEDVAAWYQEHGARLFDLNIRNPLGPTRTNSDIVRTLVEQPANFWYFNNGITILCERMQPAYRSMGAPKGSPVTIDAQSVSIVNGAQTVTAIAEAMFQNPGNAALAQVSVRLIETSGIKEFAQRTTQATNQQNRVEERDFIALDPIQSEIRADLATELDKEYTIKRGAIDPAPEGGCSIVEAATALACAHPKAEYAARARLGSDRLWERGERGTYQALFHPQPSAHAVWRSVITVRAVREALRAIRPRPEGRAAAIAQHCELLIAHIVLRHPCAEQLEEPGFDWETKVVPQVPEVTELALRWLIHRIDTTYGTTAQIVSTATNPERCDTLARAVMADMVGRSELPSMPAEYLPAAPARRARRRNAVPTLVDAKALSDGTRLVFRAQSLNEMRAIADWLAADPRRGEATWVNDRGKPILWAADQQQYSPSGLVHLIWRRAGWEDSPRAVQGPSRWHVGNGESLWDIALRVQEAGEDEEA